MLYLLVVVGNISVIIISLNIIAGNIDVSGISFSTSYT